MNILDFIFFWRRNKKKKDEATRLLSPMELNKMPIYDNLDEALETPEKVFRLVLKKRKYEKLPVSFAYFKRLHELDLSYNSFQSVSGQILECKNIQILNLSNN